MNTSLLVCRVACGLGLLSLLACGDKAEAPAAASPAGATSAASSASAPTTPMAPVTVTTVPARKRDLPVLLKASGIVTPLTSVDVKPQLSSMVARVHIQDGQFVKTGDLLITLDSRTDEANVAKARAQLAKDNAALADAQRQLVRAQQLLAQKFISQGALDTAQAQVDAQTAAVLADQAAIDAARVALSYARITAPVSGRAGAVSVSAGSAVQANLTTLVTVTQLDPIAVAFSLPQRNLPDALAALGDGGAMVQATLPDGAGSFKGQLKFVDNMVDASSGSVKVKAVFDNRERKLWPGAFVEVSQTVNTLKDAVVVPQAAIIQSARGTIVYIMEAGNAVLRPVQVLQVQDGDAAVSGLRAGEVVVLSGKQNVRPGAPLVERARDSASAPSVATPSKASAP